MSSSAGRVTLHRKTINTFLKVVFLAGIGHSENKAPVSEHEFLQARPLPAARCHPLASPPPPPAVRQAIACSQQWLWPLGAAMTIIEVARAT